MISKLIRRLSYWLRRDQIEADLREEIEAHRLMREDALRRQGEATPAADSRRVLGNTMLAREDARHVWIWPWLETVLLDIRHGMRSLRRHRTFTATALITIAVGTGTLTAGFAVAHTVLLKSVPYANADRIVQILRVTEGRARSQVSSADLDTLRAATALEVVSFASNNAVSLTGDALPENARAIATDRHLFPMLGSQPLLGRWPSAADEASDAPPAVLSHPLWMRRYQGRTDIIGGRVDINGRPHTILAVMPPEYRFPAPYYVTGDLWIFRDATHPSITETDRPLLLGFALLAPGQSRARAQMEVDTIASGGAVTFQLTDWAGSIRRSARPTLLLLTGAAGLVFLIVCINLFNLLLCRSLDRSAEMSTRASLGAGNRRLMRQLVTESTVLFAVGGAAGSVLAVWFTRGISAIASFDIPRMNETGVHWTVGVAGFVLACLAGVVVGWIPAIRAARGSQVQGLATRSITHHRRGRLMQRALITAEISLAVLLVCGAGTIGAHVGKYTAADSGFDSDRVVRAWLPIAQYPDVAHQRRVFDDLLTRLRAHPQIAAAGIVDLHPGLAAGATPSVLLDGDPVPAKAQALRSAAVRVASEGYLETLGLRPMQGRFFRATDGQPVAVVNDTFVKTHLVGRDPLGASVRITLDGLPELDPVHRVIVGVVPDIKEDVLHRPAPPTVYIPVTQRQTVERAVAVVVRPVSDSAQLATTIRELLARAAPGVAVSGAIRPLGSLMEGDYARTGMSLRIVGALAAVALILSVVGVYGVTAHGVQHREREIGVRLALGAAPSAVRRMILAEGAVLLSLGVISGGGLALWLSPVVRSLVVGMDQVEVLGPLAGAAVVLTLAVWAGCDIPARRAARVDPATALR